MILKTVLNLSQSTSHEEHGEIFFRASNLLQLSFQVTREYLCHFLLKSNPLWKIHGWFFHAFISLTNSHHKLDKLKMMKILFFFLRLIVNANINQFHCKGKKKRGKVNTAVIVNICNMTYRHGMPEFVIFKEYVFIVQNLILQNWVIAQKLIWLLFHDAKSILSLSTSKQDRVTSSKAWYLFWNVLILLNCEDTSFCCYTNYSVDIVFWK